MPETAMRTLLLAGTAALTCLLAACQQDVVVNTPTTPPVEGFVSQPNTPAPTSANTVDALPARDLRLDSTARPLWLRQHIQGLLAKPRTNPRIRILRYRFDGETVYYETAPCCDQFTTLYDQKGNVLCHPEGGITGRGDEACGKFDKLKTDEQLVWQDPR